MSGIAALVTDNLDIWSGAIERKGSAGRGSSKKINLYGIGQLRVLIMDLAVRGKLVGQNVDDEPAASLLELSKTEQMSKVTKGLFRPPAKLPPPEQIENLPVNWVSARLGELVRVINGRAYKKPELLSEGTPVLRVGNLFTSNDWYYSDLELEPDKYIDDGDLIYAWSASFGPFIWSGGKVIYHYHIWKLEPFAEASVSKQFLRLLLANGTAAIKASGHGIAMLHMTKDRMEKLAISLPPLAEQKRIVAKVDELMALCDALERKSEDAMAAHQELVENLLATLTTSTNAADLAANWVRLETHFETLFTTEPSIDALKQTILDLAVRGKLVEQDANDEPASELLADINKLKSSLKKRTKTEKVAGGRGEIMQIELPSGWELAELQQVFFDIHYGYTASADPDLSETRLLRITDIQNGEVDWNTVPGCQISEKQASKYLIQDGDIMIARTGGTIGKTYLAKSVSVRAVFASYLIRAKAIDAALSPYFQTYFGSDIYWKQLYANSAGTGQPNVNATALKSLKVPLPPLAEQKRIVAMVDELMALCDQLKSRLAAATETQRHLADAITQQAAA